VLPMLHCWRILVSLKMSGGFESVLAVVEKEEFPGDDPGPTEGVGGGL
jgi:hypothetical protein